MQNRKYKAGSIVELAGIKFVVLENQGPCPSDGEYDRLFILALESQGDAVFGNCNNYAESKLREKVDKWLYRLTETLNEDYGVENPAIYKRHIDLSTLDGYKGFGAMDVAAAPLTMDEAREYAEYIPNPDEACWLATGWGAPEHFGATDVLGVGSSGGWVNGYCSVSFGIRPALVISSAFLSSVDKSDLGEKWHGIVRWCNRDLVGIAQSNGWDMTEEEADAWWAENEESLKALLTEYGNDLLMVMTATRS